MMGLEMDPLQRYSTTEPSALEGGPAREEVWVFCPASVKSDPCGTLLSSANSSVCRLAVSLTSLRQESGSCLVI